MPNLLSRLFRPSGDEVVRFTTSDYIRWLSQGGRYGLTQPYNYGAVTYSQGKPAERVENSFEGYVYGAYKSNPIVFGAMTARSSVFSEARFMWRRIEDGRPGELFSDDALKVLARPWPNGTTGELLTRMIQDVDLAGNFYAVNEGDRLRRLRPDWVSIVLSGDPRTDQDVDVVGYVYTPGGPDGGNSQTFLPNEVCAWSPIPDPDALYRGMSWLTPVVREIQGDLAATDHKLAFFRNGATLGPIIKVPAGLTAQQFKDFVAQTNDTHQGTDNAYRPLVIGAGADVTLQAATMQQLDFRGLSGSAETRICVAARVPAVIAGVSEGLAGSSLNAGNYSTAKRSFADGCLRPLWRSACAALQTILDVPADAELWFDERDIAFLRDDAQDVAQIQSTQATALASLVTNGWEPDSSAEFVASNDIGKLKHSGNLSVQLQPAGSGDLNGDGQPDAQAQAADQYQQVLESLRAELDDEDDLWRSDLDDEIERKYYDVRVPKGFEGGGRFRSLSDRIGHALNQWLSGDGEHDDPLAGFNRDQLRKASVEFGVTPRRGASAEEIKLGLLTDARARFRAGKDAKSPEAGKPVRFTLKGGDPKLAREVEVENKIRAYFRDHKTPGGWASIAGLRDSTSDIDRAELDTALERLAVTPGVQVIPWDNTKALSQADRDAALWLGGQNNHAFRFEDPSPRPVPKSHHNLDVGVFNEGGKLALWEVSDSGQRKRRVAVADDLAGLEAWADEHGEPELAGWARKERGGAEATPVSTGYRVISGTEANRWGRENFTPIKDLPDDQQTAIRHYAGGAAYSVNKYLRTGQVGPSNRQPVLDDITGVDAIMAAHTVPENVVVARAVGTELFDGDPSKWVGRRVTESAYMSTTLGDKVTGVQGSKPVHMVIDVPSGTHGYYMHGTSEFKEERELLLDRGLALEITDATQSSRTGKWAVKARVVSGDAPSKPAPAKVAKAAVPPAPTVRQRLLALPTNDERRQYLTNIGMTQAQSNALAKELGARQTRISVDATIDSIINHFNSSPTEHGGGPPQVAKKAAPSKAVGPEIATVNSMKDLTDLQIKQADHLTSTGRRALDSLGPEGHPRIAAIADTEGKIREAYRMLSGPGAGSGDHYVAFSDVRKLLGDQVSRTDFDDTIRRMVTQPGVRAVPQSYGRSNAAVRIPAAVIMGGQEHDQLHIDDPTLAKPQDFGAVVMAEELQHRRAGRPGDPMMSNLTDAELHTEIAARAARDPVVARDLAAMGFVPASKAPTKKATPASAPDLASLRTLDTESRRDALDLRKVDELKAMLRESGLPVSGRKRELVDRLVEHLDRSDLVTPGTPAAKFAGDYATRRDALHAAHGGEPRITPLEGGISSSVDLLTYPDGIRVVRKDYARSPGRTVGPQSTDRVPADSEELAAQVLNAVGVPAPAVNRVNNHTIDMEFVDGVQGGESGALKAPTTIRDSEQGRLLGLADAIMGHRDRNGGGWMRTADGIVPIDNGNAFEHHRPQAAHGNPFASYLMTANGWKRDLPLDRGDLAGIRTRLEVLRPEFQRLGRQNNFTEMMDRLDGIAANATDRPRLVEHLGGGGSAAPEPLSPAALLASLPSDLTPAQKRARLRSRGVPKAEIDALVPLAKAPSRDFDDLADRVSQLKTADEVYSVLTDLNATELAKLARKFPGGTRRLSSGNEASTSTGLKVPADLSLEDKRRWLAHKLKEWRFHWRSAAPDDDEIERAEVDDTYDDELSPLELEAMAVGEEEPTLDQIRAMAEDDEDDELLRAMAVGDEFEAYWTRGKGLKRWAAKPHPWRTLHRLLLKHPGIHDAEGLASHYFHVVFGIWPGERKGDNPVGPG